MLGLTAGAVLVNNSAIAKGFDQTEILKLTPEQQVFMHGYEKWMDEFTQVVKVQKTEPDNLDNHAKMIALTQKAEEFNPKLAEYMQDGTFAVIFQMSISRLTNEIA